MKHFKRLYIISLAVLIMFSFSACKIYGGSDKESTSSANFEDLLTATNKDEKITDFEGNEIDEEKAQKEIDEFNKGEVVISESKASATKKSKTTKKSEVVNGTTKKTKTTKKNKEDFSFPANSNFNALYEDYFAKGLFTIDGTMIAEMDGTQISMPFKLGMNGDKQYIYAAFTQEGIQVSLIVNENKSYLVIPMLKSYSEVEDMDLSGDDAVSSLTSDLTYASTKKVKISDEIYDCEEVKDSANNSIFFYFQNGELKRIKFSDADGASLLKVNSIIPTVNKKDFKVPSGYNKVNLDKLFGE